MKAKPFIYKGFNLINKENSNQEANILSVTQNIQFIIYKAGISLHYNRV